MDFTSLLLGLGLASQEPTMRFEETRFLDRVGIAHSMHGLEHYTVSSGYAQELNPVPEADGHMIDPRAIYVRLDYSVDGIRRCYIGVDEGRSGRLESIHPLKDPLQTFIHRAANIHYYALEERLRSQTPTQRKPAKSWLHSK